MNGNVGALVFLLADSRTSRTCPPASFAEARETYEYALKIVKRPRNARFKGIVRAIIRLRRMHHRAVEAAYRPGGAGFIAAERNFITTRGMWDC